MAKRDIIIEKINEGGATVETLMEAVKLDTKGLSSQFTYLRLMGKCPVKDDKGVYSFVSSDEWEAIKAARVVNKKPAKPAKSPEERLKAAKVRVDKTVKAADAANEKNLKHQDSEELSLRNELAQINVKLARIELAKAQDNFDNSPKESAVANVGSEESPEDPADADASAAVYCEDVEGEDAKADTAEDFEDDDLV